MGEEAKSKRRFQFTRATSHISRPLERKGGGGVRYIVGFGGDILSETDETSIACLEAR